MPGLGPAHLVLHPVGNGLHALHIQPVDLGAVKTIHFVEFPGVPGVEEGLGALLIEDMALVGQDGIDAVDEHDDRE